MNCPNCGAALEALPNRAHLRCGHCESLHFPEPTGEGVVLLDQEHRSECPHCQKRLTTAVLDGGEVGYCGQCRGMLLSSDHFAKVVASRREVRELEHKQLEPIDPKELRRSAGCPKCKLRMDTHPFGGGGNAVVDSCYRCKLVWLDAGELTVLEQFASASA